VIPRISCSAKIEIEITLHKNNGFSNFKISTVAPPSPLFIFGSFFQIEKVFQNGRSHKQLSSIKSRFCTPTQWQLSFTSNPESLGALIAEISAPQPTSQSEYNSAFSPRTKMR
jgi:hypothetical protein